MNANDQSDTVDQLLSALRAPGSNPDGAPITVIQTHISTVFLNSAFAYKVKKPVRLPFLDYRDPEARRHFCEEEIRLNRRLCPDTYLDVVQITRDGGALRIGGAGEPVDWAVRMRRLRAEEMLTARLEAGTIGRPEIRNIARSIAEFHNRAGTSDRIAAWGSPDRISSTFSDALDLMDRLAASAPQSSRDWIRPRLNHLLLTDRDLLTARRQRGCIRDCHGDLRTQNICLDPRYDHGVQIFDCIDFNQEFRYIDVAADLAYLAMDLDLAGRSDLRAALIAEYSAARPDADLNQALQLYRVYRACVRGNIALLGAREPEIQEDERAALKETAGAAYDLARGYLRQSSGAALFIMSGFSGSGKSRLAHELGRRIPAAIISSDAVRKARAGLPPSAPAASAHYSAARRSEVYAELYRQARGLLLRGEHALLDATFLEPEQRTNASNLARECRADIWLIECMAPDEVIRQRLRGRQSGTNASDADVSVYERQRCEYVLHNSTVESPPGARHLLVDTDRPVEAAARQVLDAFAK